MGKSFRGQAGFPTPDDIPVNTACRLFVVPDDSVWPALLEGAVQLLLNPHNWYNWGNLSIDDTVDHWADIVDDSYQRALVAQCAVDMPTPYWEEDNDNAGGESSAVSQGWYGELVNGTWSEKAADWTLAGFLAIAVSPNAAILYLTYVPQFRLALRTHDLGSAVEIILDGVQILTGDTYSATPGVMYFDVFADLLSPGVSPHTVEVVKST